MAHKIPYIKYLSALLLSGLNGVVILNGVSGGIRTPAKVTEPISPPPPRKVQNLRLSRRFCFIWRISR